MRTGSSWDGGGAARTWRCARVMSSHTLLRIAPMSTSSVVTDAPEAVLVARGFMRRPFVASTSLHSRSMSDTLRRLSGICGLRLSCVHGTCTTHSASEMRCVRVCGECLFEAGRRTRCSSRRRSFTARSLSAPRDASFRNCKSRSEAFALGSLRSCSSSAMWRCRGSRERLLHGAEPS